jgi:hypothetical protein
MSADSPTTVVAIPICAECRAELPVAAKYCWLCGKPIQPYSPNFAPVALGAPCPQRQSLAVLWALVAVAFCGLILLSGTAPVVLYDPIFVATAVSFMAIAVVTVTLLARSARVAGRPWQAEKTAAISMLGVVTAIGVAVIATIVLGVVLAITFLITCGAAGRLPT